MRLIGRLHGAFLTVLHRITFEEGVILNLAENHSFELIAGLGEGSNNLAELLSLKLLLIFVAEKGCSTIRIFGDSLNVINWVKKIQTCNDLLLCNILLSI